MRLFILGSLLIGFLGSAGTAQACGPEVRIRFAEESPDRFRITFVRGPRLRLVTLSIRLDGSAAGAIFDDYDGLAMQGPQPNASGVTIRSIKYRAAGQETVTLAFDGFTEKGVVDFRSDLDDNGRAGDPDQNHLVDGELAGASAEATLVATNGRRITIQGRFDQQGVARLGERACV
ncbi:MAG: hypothetical protein ACR2PI_06140 [Hyphomicrobiaceae bacterium]